MRTVYLDHCGTTKPHPAVVQKMLQVLHEDFGNPSATHHMFGQRAREHIEKSRDAFARSFHVKPKDVFFTGTCVEASNLVIQGFARMYSGKKARIFFNPIEHKGVRDTCEHMGKIYDIVVQKIPISREADLDLNFLEEQLKKENLPTLVAVMHTHNEIPHRFPVEDIAKLCDRHNTYFHCDAVQGIVREEISAESLSFHSLTFSPHKFYGPKGVGVLVISSERENPLSIQKLIFGGEQEYGLRPGTHNVAAIAGAQVAFDLLERERSARLEHLKQSADLFLKILRDENIPFHLTVSPRERGGEGVLNLWFENIPSSALLESLPHVAINRGSSCLGPGGEKISHVPTDLGLPVEIAANVIRVSFGENASLDDVAFGAHELAKKFKIEHYNVQKKIWI